MGRSVSLGIGDRVVAVAEGGQSCRGAARADGGPRAVRIMQRKRRRTGGVRSAPQGRPRRRKSDTVSDGLRARVETEPDLTMTEPADARKPEHDRAATPGMLSRRLIHRLGFT